MQLLIINRTRYVHGGHATTILMNEYVNARLGSYGSAVEQVELLIFYPPKTRPGRSPGGFTGFWTQVGNAPHVTFFRKRKRIAIQAVCRTVGVRRIEQGGHLTFAEAGRVAECASDALELVRPKVRPSDAFDGAAFLREAQAALQACPSAIQRFLAPTPELLRRGATR